MEITKQCPYCKEEIQADAIKCKHCGEYLQVNDVRSTANTRQTAPLPPNTYLVWAILVTIFCCLPFGIVSIVYAAKVESAYARKEYEEAERVSKQARNWMLAGLISGVVIGILYFVLVFAGIFAGIAAESAPFYW